MWIEFDGLRVKEALSVTDLCKDAPVYHSHSKELREKLADEMLYIVNHPQESSFHLIGHLYLFLDYLLQSAKSATLISSGRMSDYYIKEAINYMEQNFQNTIRLKISLRYVASTGVISEKSSATRPVAPHRNFL